MLQKNVSGSTLTVMTDPPVEIAAGGELEHDQLIGGFEAVDVSDVKLDDHPVSHEAADPSAGELPAAPDVVVPEDPEPAPAPVVTLPAPVEPASVAPVVSEPVASQPVAPVVEAPAAPAWPAVQPGGTTVTAV